MSLNSLSRMELKYQTKAVHSGTTNGTANSGHKPAFRFYPWAYFQILNYFSAQTSSSVLWRMELSS